MQLPGSTVVAEFSHGEHAKQASVATDKVNSISGRGAFDIT